MTGVGPDREAAIEGPPRAPCANNGGAIAEVPRPGDTIYQGIIY